MDHGSVAQHGQVEAVAVEGDELRAQFGDLIAERGDQLVFPKIISARSDDAIRIRLAQLR